MGGGGAGLGSGVGSRLRCTPGFIIMAIIP